jgi:hypothetical protein
MAVNAPISVLEAPPEQELFIVRGDRFEMSVGFTEIENPATVAVVNRLRLAFRRQQLDSLPDFLAVNATLDPNPPDAVNGTPLDIMGTFVLTPDQTASIPAAGAYYFIEWTDLNGGTNSRVVQGRVRVGD